MNDLKIIQTLKQDIKELHKFIFIVVYVRITTLKKILQIKTIWWFKKWN